MMDMACGELPDGGAIATIPDLSRSQWLMKR
jgi:hypothetical protein